MLSNKFFLKAYQDLIHKPYYSHYKTVIFLNSSTSSFAEQALYEIAQNYMAEREFQKAEDYLKKLNDEFPENRLAYAGLSMIRYIKTVETEAQEKAKSTH